MSYNGKVYWKVKFLVDLPNILWENVTEKIRKQYDGIILNDNLIYGQLHLVLFKRME